MTGRPSRQAAKVAAQRAFEALVGSAARRDGLTVRRAMLEMPAIARLASPIAAILKRAAKEGLDDAGLAALAGEVSRVLARIVPLVIAATVAARRGTEPLQAEQPEDDDRDGVVKISTRYATSLLQLDVVDPILAELERSPHRGHPPFDVALQRLRREASSRVRATRSRRRLERAAFFMWLAAPAPSATPQAVMVQKETRTRPLSEMFIADWWSEATSSPAAAVAMIGALPASVFALVEWLAQEPRRTPEELAPSRVGSIVRETWPELVM